MISLKKLATTRKNLFLLATLMTFFWGLGFCFLDVGTTSLLLLQKAALIPFDFLWTAFALAGSGYLLLKLKRQQAYHAPLWLGGLWGILGTLLWARHGDKLPVLEILFVYKYCFFLLGHATLYFLIRRLTPLKLECLFFLGVLVAELLGYAVGGFFNLSAPLKGPQNLSLAFSILSGSFFLAFVLSQLKPIPKIVFAKITHRVQDAENKKLLGLVWGISCGLSFCFCLISFLFYTVLSSSTLFHIIDALGLLWLSLGLGGCCFILFKKYFQRLLMRLGLGGLLFSIFFCTLGAFLENRLFIGIGTILFVMLAYLCLPDFMALFLHPLTMGRRLPEKKVRYIFIVPTGFLGAALCLLNGGKLVACGALLCGMGIALSTLFFITFQVYTAIILKSFRLRFWRDAPLWLNRKILKTILENLKTDNLEDMAYFLSVLEQNHSPLYPKYLIHFLRTDNPEIQEYILDKMQDYPGGLSFLKPLEKCIHANTTDLVRSKALALLISKGDAFYPDGFNRYVPYLDQKDLSIGALSGLLSLKGDKMLLAMEELHSLSMSLDPEDNIKAAKIIQTAPHLGFVRTVMHLIKRPNTKVVQEALLAAGAVRHPELLPFIFQSLDDLALQEYALVALKKFGKSAFPPIEKAIEDDSIPRLRRQTLILFLAALPSGEGQKLLLRTLENAPPVLRKLILQLMLTQGVVWIHKDRKRILKKTLHQDMATIHLLRQYQRTFTVPPTQETTEAFYFLTKAIREDTEVLRDLVLLQLDVLLNYHLAHQAILMLLGKDKSTYDLALGVLQDVVPKKLFKELKPLVIDEPIDVEGEALPVPKILKACEDLFSHTPDILSPWGKAMILYMLRKLGNASALPLVKQALKSTHPVVLETAIWAYAGLESNKTFVHHTLLKVPTYTLAHQNLEDILK